MAGTTPNFHKGSKVNVKDIKWSKQVFTIRRTWYTVDYGRLYQVADNNDKFKENEVRKAKQ